MGRKDPTKIDRPFEKLSYRRGEKVRRVDERVCRKDEGFVVSCFILFCLKTGAASIPGHSDEKALREIKR